MALTEKAFLEIEGTTATIPCMFNPAELSVVRTNTWAGTSLAGQRVPQAPGATGALAGQIVRIWIRTSVSEK